MYAFLVDLNDITYIHTIHTYVCICTFDVIRVLCKNVVHIYVCMYVHGGGVGVVMGPLV